MKKQDRISFNEYGKIFASKGIGQRKSRDNSSDSSTIWAVKMGNSHSWEDEQTRESLKIVYIIGVIRLF